jgi:uncharacterized protein (TIGR03067 family)
MIEASSDTRRSPSMYPAVILALAVTVAAPKPKDPPKKETPSIVGEWVAEKVVVGGTEVPAGAGLDGLRLTFAADGTTTVQVTGQKPKAGAYTADPKKEPPEIDLLPTDGKGEPPGLGVYKLDGDTLVLCMAQGRGAERPKRVESPAGSQALLITFKRAKKD